ncbi:hypothetical protein JTE90_006677 [Oedothorax gibbosus]|uniref:Outer dynein arm-docking complex subunit 4 n=1 Tax=Oedothorax gibbosus TaxID=931172 RepID=A0AAV6V2D4_9ARAC|nr:hypothetical protein JTE90_006677 [Oedothorax gibbosus]
MSRLTVQPPGMLDALAEDFRKTSIDETMPQWQEISKMKLSPFDHRGSVLPAESASMVSEDSRRPSLLADAESELTKMLSIDSSGLEPADDERRVSRTDEIYTDKARAAMVVIGTKDIKEALERKKAVEKFRKSPEAKSAAILFEQARFLVHQSRFKEALVFINKALKVDAKRKDWITEKSLCYFKMLKPETALNHVDEVLTMDSKYFQALLLKGEILYSMWDLERAMLCFVEGRRLRPENSECLRGVHKIRMALEEISAYRDTQLGKKRKKSLTSELKLAKSRSVSLSPTRSPNILSANTARSSSRRYSSRISPISSTSKSSSTVSLLQDEVAAFRAQRPRTAYVRRRTSSIGKELLGVKLTNEAVPNTITEEHNLRLGTGVGKRSPTSLKPQLCLDDIVNELSDRSSRSGSWKSDSSFKMSNQKSRSDESEGFEPSDSSSMEGSYKGFKKKKILKKRSKELRAAEKVKRIKPISSSGPKIAAALEKDRVFVESLMKNKGLRNARTPYTKKVLRIVRDLHSFVVEREEYWNNRERFIRHVKMEDPFIA